MALEEIRRVDQELGDVFFGDGLGLHGGSAGVQAGLERESGSSMLPSNTVVAGPVMNT